MQADLTLEAMKELGAVRPAKPDDVRLYQEAFKAFGLRALWSSRPVENPTIADLLAITESLRVEGGIEGRRLAVRIEQACRAAL